MRLQYLALFVVLTLLQVLVFNNLILFNTAVCFVFIYLIIRLPLSVGTNLLLTIAFVSGFTVDIFSDTPGLCSLSAVCLSVLKKPFAFLYISKDDKTKGETLSLRTMGWGAYSKYLLTCCALFSLICFTLDFFSFASIFRILAMVGSSTLFTFLILLSLDCIQDSFNYRRN